MTTNPMTTEEFFQPLLERIEKGRAKYPNGCTLLSLQDELGEVVHAVNKFEGISRVRDELLDVAAVAMRMYHGELDQDQVVAGLTIEGHGFAHVPATLPTEKETPCSSPEK